MEISSSEHFVFYVKELISTDLCRTIIELYSRDSRKRPGHTASVYGDRQLEPDVKVSTDLDIEPDGVWSAAFAELHPAITRVVLSIAEHFPSLKVAPLRSTGYKIQHYRKAEGQFKWHFDAFGPGGWDRQLAVIVYLNSVEAGGETSFYRQKLQFKPVAGDALFFPTFWTHMHCGEIPLSQDKYVISSFIRFELPPATNEPA
jgi:hypothetical protein